jgi:hypothetical protein
LFTAPKLGEGGSILQLIRLRVGARVSDKIAMKSAYELAMERLQKQQPTVALNEEQKKLLAEIDSTFKAKIAERELFLKDQMRKTQSSGKFDEVEAIEKQLAAEIRRLNDDCEAKKEKLRASFAK